MSLRHRRSLHSLGRFTRSWIVERILPFASTAGQADAPVLRSGVKCASMAMLGSSSRFQFFGGSWQRGHSGTT